uniref:Uncharacterized protein n=1 Tax=Tanacetum cinerariifolium TaxID=118510 RepID=A0A6L2L4L5_TANCI|nr:hypothetical protein [Tanacetum cinerariifolium]
MSIIQDAISEKGERAGHANRDENSDNPRKYRSATEINLGEKERDVALAKFLPRNVSDLGKLIKKLMNGELMKLQTKMQCVRNKNTSTKMVDSLT